MTIAILSGCGAGMPLISDRKIEIGKREHLLCVYVRSAAAGICRSFGILSLFLCSMVHANATDRCPASPQSSFGQLYGAVERAGLFSDSKEFADAVPNSSPGRILDIYRAARPQTKAQLRDFVLTHFQLPSRSDGVAVQIAGNEAIAAHINDIWPHLERETGTRPRYSSLVPLPHPYAVPGGRFREMYYWDSYFTMLGLAQSGHVGLVRNMVDDFASLIDRYGHIPNGNRTYYLGRSQPPFFFEMVALLDPKNAARAYARYLPELMAEYRFWMNGSASALPGTAHRRIVVLSDGAVLNRYWGDCDRPRDESYREDVALAEASGRNPRILYRELRAAAESGWDFSSRWFSDGRSLATIGTTKIVPVDLNSLMYGLETAIREGCQERHNLKCVAGFSRHAAARRAAMNRYLWNPAAGIYSDYRWATRKAGSQLTAAALYPLFVHAASHDQARSVAGIVRDKLVEPAGLVTTRVDTGQQWDAPNGWAPLQWIAVSGLRDYGEMKLSELIACRWMVNVQRVYHQTGKLLEKYNVMNPHLPGGGGEYPLQDGFGWTNGVMLRLMALYPNDTHYSASEQCPTGRRPAHDGTVASQLQ